MLVCLGVRLDADHARGRASEHVRAIALAAGHVDDAQPPHTRGDPFVYDQMAAKPVVLGRDVGERSLSRQRQRWNALGLITLPVGISCQGGWLVEVVGP
jgi:hypothetical protein